MPRIQQNPSEFFVRYLDPGEPFSKSGMAEEEVGPKKTGNGFLSKLKTVSTVSAVYSAVVRPSLIVFFVWTEHLIS